MNKVAVLALAAIKIRTSIRPILCSKANENIILVSYQQKLSYAQVSKD